MYDNYDNDGKNQEKREKVVVKESTEINKSTIDKEIEEDCFDNIYGSKIESKTEFIKK